MARILLLYSSTDGQTKKIAEFMDKRLSAAGDQITCHSIHEDHPSFEDFDTLILGASIRYGKHHKEVIGFIKRNRNSFKSVRTAFFSVNLVARKSEKSRADTNPYVIKFIKDVQWQPDLLDVFAGVLDYDAYGFFDALMIRLIMKMTKGPTRTTEPIEYTNWSRVEDFCDKVNNLN